MRFSIKARMTAVFVGTAFLLAAVVGYGIIGEGLSGGNVAVALLAKTIATGAALVAVILTFGSVSGAHFNPAVTLADASQRGIPWGEVPRFVSAQIAGAYMGVACADLIFGLPRLFSASRHTRRGVSQVFSEFVETFGLLWVEAANLKPEKPISTAAYEHYLHGIDLYSLNEFASERTRRSVVHSPAVAAAWIPRIQAAIPPRRNGHLLVPGHHHRQDSRGGRRCGNHAFPGPLLSTHCQRSRTPQDRQLACDQSDRNRPCYVRPRSLFTV